MEVRKIIVVFMERNRRCNEITAGGFFVLSRDTLVSVCIYFFKTNSFVDNIS